MLLQVNRLHNSVHSDGPSLPDDPTVDAVQSASDHCEYCRPFPPCFSQVSMSLEEDSPCEAESCVGPDEAIPNVFDGTDDACYSERDSTWVAASLFWRLTEVKVPPETKILYEDWNPRLQDGQNVQTAPGYRSGESGFHGLIPLGQGTTVESSPHLLGW